MSDLEDICSEIEEQFNQAADHLQNIHTTLSPNVLLELYGLYKQSTVGTCRDKKPNILNMQARSKWTAWNKLKDMKKPDAMNLYINKIKRADPSWSFDTAKKPTWIRVSIEKGQDEEILLNKNKTIFDYAKEGDLIMLKEKINEKDINSYDENGLALIHWATDRNNLSILEYLLDKGANINLQDCDGQTALHYATSCGHIESLKLLLKHGADKSILDNDNVCCVDCAFDKNIIELLNN